MLTLSRSKPNVIPAARGEPRSEWRLITPDEAAYILEHQNNRNVHPKEAKAQRYADIMRAGKWERNGEPIHFDWDGELLNGQHRLWACVLAGVPFFTMVIYDLDPATFSTFDPPGSCRTAGQVVGRDEGVKYASHVAATAKLLISYKAGEVRSRKTIEVADIAAFVKANPLDVEWVAKSASKGWVRDFATPLAATLFLGSQKYPREAEAFLTQLQEGDNLTKGSPVLALRDKLINERGGGNKQRTDRWAYIIVAWNAYVADRRLSKLALPRSESFPRVSGTPKEQQA